MGQIFYIDMGFLAALMEVVGLSAMDITAYI
jgi:hypothetical protein